MPDLRLHGIGTGSVLSPTRKAVPTPDNHPAATKKPFQEVLRQQLQPAEITWSKHAQTRLQEANIHWDESRDAALSQAVDKVRAKGGRSSLVFMPDVALVVSVPNRTVITAMNVGRLEDHVFTQIDSAVIIPDDFSASRSRT